jgi:very-short-patch-repair endonuclease
MSASERVLWEHLRKKGVGFGFRRQVPVGPYVLDFYCASAALCVEVDGEQHSGRVSADRSRDEYLARAGIKTIRIPSVDLFESGSPVAGEWMRTIRLLCEERCAGSLPLPPPSVSEP